MFQHKDVQTLRDMKDRAKRVSDMMYRRAVEAYWRACGARGEMPQYLDMCIIHNSLVAREWGTPWAEIDYHYMRKAAWIMEQSYIPDRLVNRWYRRKCGLPAD